MSETKCPPGGFSFRDWSDRDAWEFDVPSDEMIQGLCEEVDDIRRQLAVAKAENALLRNQLIGELRSELALSSAYGAIATIAHCENRLAELEAAEAVKEAGR